MKTQHIPLFIKSSVLLISAAFASPAFASGYHFGTQSVSAQSTANSSAAEAADPSTLFYNPAGLTHLEGTQATINLNLVAPNVKYENAKATYYPPVGKPDDVKGERSGNIADDIIAVPHAYASHQLNDKVSLGVGLFVPFGSGTEYDHDSVLRYNLNKLGLETIAIQPTLAYKINDQHSVAVGLVAQHTSAELRQYANFGPALKSIAGQGNGTADGYAKVEGDDWGFGYNLAWMWDVNPDVRVGVNYRSKVNHNLRGTAEWHLTGDIFTKGVGSSTMAQVMTKRLATNGIRQAGYAESEDASVKIVTPESLSVHGMWRATPKLNLFGDLTWTRHSRFNEAHLYYANAKSVADPVNLGQTTKSNETILNPSWRNTWRVSLGATYQLSEPLQLRAGVAYDQSPVKNADYRMSTLPDNDRIWLSLGAKYDFNRNHSLNVAYSHLFIKNASANVNGYCGGTAAGAGSVACVSSRTAGSANFKSSADILGLQYTYKF